MYSTKRAGNLDFLPLAPGKPKKWRTDRHDDEYHRGARLALPRLRYRLIQRRQTLPQPGDPLMPLATATNPYGFFPKRGLLFAPISPVIVLAIWCQQASGQAAAFKDAVRPLIENHCITCHGPEVQKAKLRLDDLQPDLRDERIMATWAKVYDKLVTGEMPPKNRERPAQDELQRSDDVVEKGTARGLSGAPAEDG